MAGAVQDALVTRVGRAGLLTDVPLFDVGLGLTVRPSMSAGGGVEDFGSSFCFDPGIGGSFSAVEIWLASVVDTSL